MTKVGAGDGLLHDRIVVEGHRSDDARLDARRLAVRPVELALNGLADIGMGEGWLAVHIEPLKARRGLASGHVNGLLHLGQHIGEVHARLWSSEQERRVA